MDSKNKKLKQLTEVVYTVLEEHKETRNDDKKLYIETCNKMGLNTNISLIDWSETHNFPSAESVSRCRRKIQSMGHFVPEDIVQENRSEQKQKFYDFSKLKEQEFNFG